ncbi:MAG: FAD-binding protein [Candidatus Abyssobacteria bacterium SURF_5]|uniref:FAD-binding protein n=1 Tax=Abyssobacteria bacterium (strain SURF_5) TaxID=2093360 RepID=A0A3A4NBZ8_ABYX5|nr:MAG: FAD-binding protein [Candidatus Abyssubacteria bacterium SURF_5]
MRKKTHMHDITPESIEKKIVFHGEVFPDNPNRKFEREEFPPPPEPQRDIDVVIIGGGAGGLTAAYRLRDCNMLLLEALPQLGGNSMYCEWEGVPFSLGGQYIGVPGTWADSAWDLCRELNLHPEKDDSPLTVAFPGDVQVQNPYSARGFLRMPLPWRVKRDILRFYFFDMPRIDIEARKDELDQISFSEFLKKYSPEFRDWYELLAKPYPNTEDASAYYAITSAREGDYAEDKGICSFPGGLALINKTLQDKVEEAGPGRMLTGAFVYSVRHDANGRVLATYWRDGKIFTVRARAAIVNAESNIAMKILHDIPEDLKVAMGRMRRFSYPTFHFCSHQPIYRRGYRVGVMGCTIQAVTVPDWFCRHLGAGRPNILSCFNKMSLKDVDTVKNKEHMVRMTARVLTELDMRFTDMAAKVEAIHVFLRTRNYCIPYPGYITSVFPTLGRPFGNVFFANAEYLNPVSHFPDAVTAGNQAAAAVRKLLQQ